MKLIAITIENLDLDLIKDTYFNLLIPNFPNRNHLEPFDDFLAAFDNKDDEFGYRKKVFILKEGDEIAGSLTTEFYPLSNVMIMPYLVVKKEYRGQKLSNILFEEAYKELDVESKRRFKALDNNPESDSFELLSNFFNLSLKDTMDLLKTLKPQFFLESEKETEVDPIMDPKDRLKVYNHIGFKILDFVYIQPNLNSTRKAVKDFYLLASQKFCSKDENNVCYVDSNTVKTFMWEFSYLLSPEKFLISKQFKEVIDSIASDKVFLRMIDFLNKN
jgi:GNAT superfamily N-acetyltransferase